MYESLSLRKVCGHFALRWLNGKTILFPESHYHYTKLCVSYGTYYKSSLESDQKAQCTIGINQRNDRLSTTQKYATGVGIFSSEILFGMKFSSSQQHAKNIFEHPS
jgi:hypothetical protein